ncbi:MAG: 16S rRNA (uracil(1498)-N(3))-methyltransferase [Deltaproteobacteria bacterium RIFOXYD12_FULL_57_12]|nr:MAG: 16S rRNA (uracil(1498)-N(3))-methyltransferase [Deltaproteobacteria bacterium RIFOXYD12_FULL_57_12]
MNLVLIDPTELDRHGIVTLRDRRRAHLAEVLGVGVGDRVRVGVVNGPVGEGRLLAMTSESAVLQVSVSGPLPARPAVDLIVALPRPLMLKRILTQTASLGVGHIFLIKANRVEKSYFQSTLLQEENWLPFLLEGLEQAMDTRLPTVTVHPRFRPFVEDLLPGIIPEYQHSLLAHPEGAANLVTVLGSRFGGRVLLAMGPEGGWVDFEVERFQSAGFASFSMGPRILRLETAVVALLAQLALLRE